MDKIVRFFEEHVEKMVLVVVGLLCAWLLITRVIFSPNSVPWDGRNENGEPVGSGVYYYKLEVGNWSDTNEMVVIR